MGFLPPEFVEYVKLRVRARRVPRFIQIIGTAVAISGAGLVVLKLYALTDIRERNVDWGQKSPPQA